MNIDGIEKLLPLLSGQLAEQLFDLGFALVPREPNQATIRELSAEGQPSAVEAYQLGVTAADLLPAIREVAQPEPSASLAEIDAEFERVLTDPTTSFWLKEALSTARRRDPVDAEGDAELLLNLLQVRGRVLLASFKRRQMATKAV